MTSITEAFRALSSRMRDLKVRMTVPLEEGNEIPFYDKAPSIIAEDIETKQELEGKVKGRLVKGISQRPRVPLDDLSVKITQPGHGSYTQDVFYEQPLLTAGGSHLFYGYNEVPLYRNALQKARNMFDDEKLQNKNIELFRELITKSLGAEYVSDDAQRIAEKRRLSASKLDEVVRDLIESGSLKESTQKDLEQKITPPINWKEKAEQSLVVEVSLQSVGHKQFGKLVKTVSEPCIQIYDPVRGMGEFDSPLTLTQLYEAYNIKDHARDDVEKTAHVLREIGKTHSGKTLIILYRDEKRDGKDPIQLSQDLKVTNAYPIINQDDLKKAQEDYKNDSYVSKKTKKRALVGLVAAAVLGAGGFFGKSALEKYQRDSIKVTRGSEEMELSREPSKGIYKLVVNNETYYISPQAIHPESGVTQVKKEKTPVPKKKKNKLPWRH